LGGRGAAGGEVYEARADGGCGKDMEGGASRGGPAAAVREEGAGKGREEGSLRMLSSPVGALSAWGVRGKLGGGGLAGGPPGTTAAGAVRELSEDGTGTRAGTDWAGRDILAV